MRLPLFSSSRPCSFVATLSTKKTGDETRQGSAGAWSERGEVAVRDRGEKSGGGSLEHGTEGGRWRKDDIDVA
jgi:hypothetical protein